MEQKKDLEQLCKLAFERHKSEVENWQEGEPVKFWESDDCEICVQYESGKCWHYKDLDLPFPSWW